MGRLAVPVVPPLGVCGGCEPREWRRLIFKAIAVAWLRCLVPVVVGKRRRCQVLLMLLLSWGRCEPDSLLLMVPVVGGSTGRGRGEGWMRRGGSVGSGGASAAQRRAHAAGVDAARHDQHLKEGVLHVDAGCEHFVTSRFSVNIKKT